MYHTGLLIESYPAVLGSDVTGVVVSTSPDCTKLHVGDYVYGCVPIGLNAYSPFQETFLVDERWIFKKTHRIGLEEASTIGAGVLVSSPFLLYEPSRELTCGCGDGGPSRPLRSRDHPPCPWDVPREERRMDRRHGRQRIGWAVCLADCEDRGVRGAGVKLEGQG